MAVDAGAVVGTDPNGREITAGDCRASTQECRDGLAYLQADPDSRRWSFSVGKGIACLEAGQCHCTIQREYDGRCWEDAPLEGTPDPTADPTGAPSGSEAPLIPGANKALAPAPVESSLSSSSVASSSSPWPWVPFFVLAFVALWRWGDGVL